MTTTLEERPREVASGIDAMAAVKFRIPGDVIARTCEGLPDRFRHAIKWAAGFCRQRNLTTEEFGELLRQPGSDKPYSGDSIYQVFVGRRNDNEGSLQNFTEAVEVYRKRVEETAPVARTAFVETQMTRRMWTTCRTALARGRISFIFGPSQIGKTTALAEYARHHNHGETIFVRMPTRGTMSDFVEEMAIRLGISARTNAKELRRRIIESFDDRTLLIVDECHECLRSVRSERNFATLDFCREIWDRRKCGIVLCGTDVFKQGLRSNPILRQLWLRGYRPLQLPAIPSQENMAEFSRAFGLSPAEDKQITVETSDDVKLKGNPLHLERQVLEIYGLGRWLAVLEDAADMAKERGTRITWGRVIVAHHDMQQMEQIA